MARIVSAIFAVAYPVFVFLSLVVFHLDVRIIGLGVLALAVLMVAGKRKGSSLPVAALMVAFALFVIFTKSDVVLKLYPVFVNIFLLMVFAFSIHDGKSMALHFAILWDKWVARSPARKAIERYCRRVTIIWCVFFVFNGSSCLLLALFAPSWLWALYSGGITYLLIGLLFFVEYLVRLKVNGRHNKMILLTEMDEKTRDLDRVVAFSGSYGEGKHITWKDFLTDSAKLRSFLEKRSENSVFLAIDDLYNFLVSLVAVMQAKKSVVLSANRSKIFLSELFGAGAMGISDYDVDGFERIEGILSSSDKPSLGFPKIDKDSKIILYTSGSTGHPKAYPHTVGEIEEDNGFFIREWETDFKDRLVFSSVYPHHIFGLIFAIMRPFMEGVPIYRERLGNPSDFLLIQDDRPLIVSTPEFMRISVEDPDLEGNLKFREPYIALSGGPLKESVAKKIKSVFGVWPTEIYGSTETGGIASRITEKKATSAWKPASLVRLSLSEEGTLVVTCPAVGGKPFVTNDLVEFSPDGSFRLLGRKDSVVKVAEKRISLDEIETRLSETDLVKDSKAVALDKNGEAVLACAVVLSDAGKRELAGKSHGEKVLFMRRKLLLYLEGTTIPKRWRFVDEIPRNGMGKVQLEKVKELFSEEV